MVKILNTCRPIPELDADQIIRNVLFLLQNILYLYFMVSKNGTKKDVRYKTVRIVMAAAEIKTFKDIFKIIPKSIVAKDMHTNNNRMERLINNPDGFTLAEINVLAKLFGCEYNKLRDLVEKGAGLVVEVKQAKKAKQVKNPSNSHI